MKRVNKHLIPLLLILVFSFFASHKLFNNKFYTSHDGEGHVIRMEEFDLSLKDGQIPVRIAKRINHGLSYPFFNFSYPLIYYLGETFHLVGFSFVDTFKALLVLSVVIGGVSVYFLSSLYFDRISSTVSSVFFIIAPYKFLNMYVRGNVAESLGLALIPTLFLAIELLIREKKLAFTFVIFSSALLILSHNITAMIGMLLGAIFFIVRLKNLKNRDGLVKKFSFAIFISLLFTAFFLLPLIVESKLTKLIELTEDYRTFFPSLQEILYSPWGFGAYKQGLVPGKMSPQIGLIHESVFIIAVILFGSKLIRREKLKHAEKFILFFIGLSLISLLLSLPISKFLWDFLYPLKLIQIPWRFVGYITLGCSIVAGFAITSIHSAKVKIFSSIVLVILLLYANRNHIRVNQYVEYQSPFLHSQVYGPSTTSKDEHMPRLAPRIYSDPNPDGDVIASTSGTSKRIIWRSNYHKFIVRLKEDADFRDNTSYFPGWIAKVDGKSTNILYRQDEFQRLRVHIPKGEHTVEFFFHETWYRLLADMVSLTTFCILLVVVLLKLSRKIWVKKR